MKLDQVLKSGVLVAGLANAEVFFKETFSDDDWESRWTHSQAKPDLGKFVLSSGSKWKVDADIEQGIQAQEDAKFYAISAKIPEEFSNEGKDLVVQFTVKNEGKKSSHCGGAYIKLHPSDIDQSNYGGDTPYYIMFGQDICGMDTAKIHTIFNHNGENLEKTEEIKLEYKDKNDLTHLYTLHVKADGTYEVFFDQKSKSVGTLLTDWAFPPKTIPDPSDIKPSDWVDEAEIDDPTDVKPEGYDDIPKKIPQEGATKPEDWDDEDDGEWEPPMVTNPDYQGEWKPKKIPNPEFKGKWEQKRIPNPEYTEKVAVYDKIGYVGFEEWIVNAGAIFDNIFIGTSIEEANEFAAETFGKIHDKEEAVKKEFEDVEKEKKKAAEAAFAEDDDDDDEKEDL